MSLSSQIRARMRVANERIAALKEEISREEDRLRKWSAVLDLAEEPTGFDYPLEMVGDAEAVHSAPEPVQNLSFNLEHSKTKKDMLMGVMKAVGEPISAEALSNMVRAAIGRSTVYRLLTEMRMTGEATMSGRRYILTQQARYESGEYVYPENGIWFPSENEKEATEVAS